MILPEGRRREVSPSFFAHSGKKEVDPALADHPEYNIPAVTLSRGQPQHLGK